MQGPLSSFGEAIGDAIDSVKAVTSNVADNVGREIAKNDILRKVGMELLMWLSPSRKVQQT